MYYIQNPENGKTVTTFDCPIRAAAFCVGTPFEVWPSA